MCMLNNTWNPFLVVWDFGIYCWQWSTWISYPRCDANNRVIYHEWGTVVTLKQIVSFTFMWPCIVTDFFIIKPTRCTNLSSLFWNETQHVSDSSFVHHQELFTVHTAMVYVIQTALKQQQDPCCSKAVYKHVWRVPLRSVQWITPDDGQRNCPKHVEFHSKINLRN
jgi:hypothetical protein